MGRNGYMTRLAFGRSAFESPERITSQSSENLPSRSSQQQGYEYANDGHIQAYDDRGHPINPRSRELGRTLREAQNDVLAAIGVVEAVEKTSSADELRLTLQRARRYEQLEQEDEVGNKLALFFSIPEYASVWWLGSFRDRILTFHTSEQLHITELIASEFRSSTIASFFFGGIASQVLFVIGVQSIVYAILVYRPIDRLLTRTNASRKVIRFSQRWKGVINQMYRWTVEIAFYPVLHHFWLQRLHLVGPRPLFPSLKAFIPFSVASPIQRIPLPSILTTRTVFEFAKDLTTAPLFLMCLFQFLERGMYSTVYEAVDSSTILPDKPDLVSPDEDLKRQATSILGFRKRTPTFLRDPINNIMSFFSWARPFSTPKPEVKPRRRRLRTPSLDDIQPHQDPIQLDGQQITDLQPLGLPTSDIETLPLPHPLASEMIPVLNISEPQSPVSHTATEASDNMLEPGVRITSRDPTEGVVELEVRLPNTITPIGTPGQAAASPFHDGSLSPEIYDDTPQKAYHRVSQLSLEPGQMLGTFVKGWVAKLATLPVRVICLRLIAFQFVAAHPEAVGRRRRVYSPFHITTEFSSWRSVGVFAGRMALCGAVELALDLGLWGCQWAIITWVGKRFFSWGRL